MKINRRQFLKVLGATAVAVALPLPRTAGGPIQRIPGRFMGIRMQLLPGPYWFRYSYRKASTGVWQRHAQIITVEDDMELTATVEMGVGDTIANLDVQEARADPRYAAPVTNYANGTATYFYEGSFSFGGPGPFPNQSATAI